MVQFRGRQVDELEDARQVGQRVQDGAAHDGQQRASFLINVPFVMAGIWAARRYLSASAWGRRVAGGRPPHSAPASGAGRIGMNLDPVGMTLLATATLLVMIPFMESSAGAWIWLIEPAGRDNMKSLKGRFP